MIKYLVVLTGLFMIGCAGQKTVAKAETNLPIEMNAQQMVLEDWFEGFECLSQSSNTSINRDDCINDLKNKRLVLDGFISDIVWFSPSNEYKVVMRSKSERFKHYTLESYFPQNYRDSLKALKKDQYIVVEGTVRKIDDFMGIIVVSMGGEKIDLF